MGSVYKLSDGELNYYGSTVDLTKRFTFHKCKANTCTSNQLNKDALYIEVVEVVEDAKQLLIRERWFIKNNECVNIMNPYRTAEDTKAAVKRKNDRRVIENRIWCQKNYIANKELIKTRNNNWKKTTCKCVCGQTITLGNKASHIKTQKHKTQYALYVT